VGATCVNTPGSRTCSCLPGFVGDGFNCAGGRVWQHGRWAHWLWRGRWGLRGARGPVPALHESAAQVITAVCTPLYKDLPPARWHAAASASINLCAVNNGGCSADATCTPTASGQRACGCKPGFSGTGTNCTPVPPTGEHMRPSPACLNSASGVMAVGRAGTRDLVLMAFVCNGGQPLHTRPSCGCEAASTLSCCCPNAGACAVNNGGCSPDATCTNSGNTPVCACKPGFTGTGNTCTGGRECKCKSCLLVPHHTA